MEPQALDALGDWLAGHLGARSITVTDASNPAGIGYSAETSVLTVEITDPDGAQAALGSGSSSTGNGHRSTRFVLRSESPDPAVYPAQAPALQAMAEVEIQRRIMQALGEHSEVPVARIIGSETDGAVLGTPFFVMEFVNGSVPSVSPPYTESGFFAEAAAVDRRRMVLGAVEVLARVHAVDWRAAGLGWLVPEGVAPTAIRQLDLWDGLCRRELRGRHNPSIARAVDLLRSELPEGSEPVLCWGDPRLGNMIFDDFTCATVTDWEAASIAPPEVDLGWWLMFDRSAHEASGVERLAGEPTRQEQRAAYAAASGRPVEDTLIWECFAAMRYAAIVVRVMNRAVERGHVPEDHTIWLENPAVDCLDHVLAEID